MSESVQDLERRVAALSRLAEVSVTLNSTLELEPLLTSIIGAAVDVLDAERASILLFDERANQLRFAASTGSDRSVLVEIPVPMDNSIAGAVFRENRPMIVDDVGKDPRHFGKVGEATGHCAESLLGVPMRVKNRVTGVLEAMNKKSGNFGDDDTHALSILADQAAVAIHNARILEELRKAYAELGDLDRMKSSFVAIASHELRTPLVVILGYADLLHTTAAMNPEMEEFARRILGSAVHMRSLIDDLTNLEYLQVGQQPEKRELTDLRQVIVEARQDVAALVKAKGQDLSVEESSLPMPVRVDRRRVVLAFTKLLGNAAHFTPDGGKIAVRSSVRCGEGWVEIEDSGAGVPAGREETIFQPFYQVEDHLTRSHSGMGLGLTIVRATVDQHGGRVWAANRTPDSGSRFTVVLPLAAANPI